MPKNLSRRFGRLLAWLVTVPLLILLVLFAVSNRQPVDLALWPLPVGAAVPLYLLVLGAAFMCLILGLLIGWASQHSVRVEVRRQRREIARLQGLVVQTEKPPTTIVTAQIANAAPTAPLESLS